MAAIKMCNGGEGACDDERGCIAREGGSYNAGKREVCSSSGREAYDNSRKLC